MSDRLTAHRPRGVDGENDTNGHGSLGEELDLNVGDRLAVCGDFQGIRVGCSREVPELDDHRRETTVGVPGAVDVDDLDLLFARLGERGHRPEQYGNNDNQESLHALPRANGSGSNRSAGRRMP